VSLSVIDVFRPQTVVMGARVLTIVD